MAHGCIRDSVDTMVFLADIRYDFVPAEAIETEEIRDCVEGGCTCVSEIEVGECFEVKLAE